MVIPGPEVKITSEPILFPPNNQRQFRMGFQADNPVHHVNACFLQRSRPLDIRGLVKSRLEFNDHRDLFPALGRLGQGTHDL